MGGGGGYEDRGFGRVGKHARTGSNPRFVKKKTLSKDYIDLLVSVNT